MGAPPPKADPPRADGPPPNDEPPLPKAEPPKAGPPPNADLEPNEGPDPNPEVLGWLESSYGLFIPPQIIYMQKFILSSKNGVN